MSKFKIFYSWQSDLSVEKTRKFIRDCIDEAIILAEESETIEAERDEATKDVTGSPNIVTTLFSKIDDCDFFIADISLCFTSDMSEKKKSPNPNVLLELGYAVKTLGWDRVLCLCNTDFGKDYPFDIAHNRITNFSFKGKSKKEVKNYISKIIFLNIRDLRKSLPRAKKGEAIHILGTYDFEKHIVKETLVPLDVTQRESYLLHNKELFENSKRLVEEILELTSKIDKCSRIENKNDIVQSNSVISDSERKEYAEITKIFMNNEIKVQWKKENEDRNRIKEFLGIDAPEDFFFLGELKYVTSQLNILNSSPTLKGSDVEKEKFEKLKQLSYYLFYLEMRINYLRTFEGMLFFPIAVQNVSARQDENINIVLKVEIGEIVEPNENLIYSEYKELQGMFCRDDDDKNDVGIICELFNLDEDGYITVEDTLYNPELHTYRIPIPTAYGLGYPEKSEKDYELELKEFIATSNGHDYYEFLVTNLRPNECKWLCYGILVKPVNNNIKITYHIRSTYSTGNLKGNFEYNIS